MSTTTRQGLATPLSQLLSPVRRMGLHSSTIIAVVFLVVYSQMVCPLLDNLGTGQLLLSLGTIWLMQILLREGLLHLTPYPGFSPGRWGFYLSVLSWLLTGIFAWGLHNGLYPQFPWHSHVKLLVGYWILGGGLLAQLDYALLERWVRFCPDTGYAQERLARRLLESFTAFALAPAVAMGLLALRVSVGHYRAFEFAGEIIFLSLSFTSIAVLVAYYWGQTLQEDTTSMLTGLEAIGEGRFDTQLEVCRADELGKIVININQMARGLSLRERIREAFGYFVSPEIAERFIQEQLCDPAGIHLGGERREVTVLMCDIRDFTPLSEQLSPEELTTCLNTHFGELVEIVRHHGGLVDKFIGDAIMAVFGLTDVSDNPTLAAVQAAQEMLAAMPRVNAQLRLPESLAPLAIGIGIHHGEVVAGYIGSPDRLSFTVVGSTVNVAARLEAQAKPPQPALIYSATVAQRIAPTIPSQVVDAVRLKGLSDAVDIYSPLTLTQRSSLSKSSS